MAREQFGDARRRQRRHREPVERGGVWLDGAVRRDARREHEHRRQLKRVARGDGSGQMTAVNPVQRAPEYAHAWHSESRGAGPGAEDLWLEALSSFSLASRSP